MGCDIHTYIEYEAYPDSDRHAWWCMGGRYNPGRDYLMFDIMAGVRGSDHTLFEPRGLPDNIGWEVTDEAYLRISDEYANQEGYCSEQQARQWSTGAYAERLIERDGKPVLVSHPDWHSHSWLTADELAQCLGQYTLVSEYGPYDVGWDAILATMRAFEDRGVRSRLVFWFDN